MNGIGARGDSGMATKGDDLATMLRLTEDLLQQALNKVGLALGRVTGPVPQDPESISDGAVPPGLLVASRRNAQLAGKVNDLIDKLDRLLG